MHYIHHFFLWL